MLKCIFALNFRNTVHFSFFIFMMAVKSQLLKQVKVNFMIIFASMIYTLFKG